MTEKLIRRAAELAKQMTGQGSGSPPAGDGAVLAGLVVASSLDLLTAEVRSLRSQIQKLRETLDETQSAGTGGSARAEGKNVLAPPGLTSPKLPGGRTGVGREREIPRPRARQLVRQPLPGVPVGPPTS